MYKPGNKEYWTGRVDKIDGDLGLRWHQIVEPINLSEDFQFSNKQKYYPVFIGFASDEGVKRNNGRVGAKEGPFFLRKACSSFASHFSNGFNLYEAGDVICVEGMLEKAQELLVGKISKIVNKKGFPIVLGGGHEVAFPSFMGLVNASENKEIGIVNIDAHLDLRIPDKLVSSGTPFFQINNWCRANKQKFNYLCLGVQEFSNTKALLKRADDLGVEYVTEKEIYGNGFEFVLDKIERFVKNIDRLYLTIDLDCFNVSNAPGVSALNPNGLNPEIVIKIIEKLKSTNKLALLDIAELNPKYDIDNRTAKLGAILIYRTLCS